MFFVPFLIMLREGLEAALIVSIIATYLNRTQRSHLMPALWLGVLSASIICFVLGWVILATTGEFPQRQQEIAEGVIAIIAACMLTYMVIWMQKMAGNLKQNIHKSFDTVLHDTQGWQQTWLLLGMVFLAVAREGLESVFFLLSAFQQDVGVAAPTGAVIGLGTAIIAGFAIYYGGVKLPLAAFFRWTSIFIIFVAAGLAAGAIRAFHEAGIWNYYQDIAFNFSNVLSTHSLFGTVLEGIFGYQETPSVSEVAVYLLYLVTALYVLLRMPRKTGLTPTKYNTPINPISRS